MPPRVAALLSALSRSLVKGVDVPIAEALGAVGHGRAEVLDGEAAAGEGFAVERRTCNGHVTAL